MSGNSKMFREDKSGGTQPMAPVEEPKEGDETLPPEEPIITPEEGGVIGQLPEDKATEGKTPEEESTTGGTPSADEADTPEPDYVNFSVALIAVKAGRSIARQGWNGKDMYVELQNTTPDSKMQLPYLYMKTAQGHLVPWLASQTDILAGDWFVI